ncbi:MAG: RsmE family RNA methyltransferase [Minisyncoccia bacterium]
MRIHRFYLDQVILGDKFDITNRDLIHQWRSVFRYNVGSQVIIFNGNGSDYLCMITSLRALGASLAVIQEKKMEELIPLKNIFLCLALIKKDNFDLVVQKATELGVNNIIPILCEHSEKKKIKIDRMQKIAVEASEQSGRGSVPKVHEVTKIQNLFDSGILPQEKIVLDPGGISWGQYKNSTNQASVAVFIGPEGGFSPKEIALFKQYNIKIVSLGSQILRAETAAIAISTLLLL